MDLYFYLLFFCLRLNIFFCFLCFYVLYGFLDCSWSGEFFSLILLTMWLFLLWVCLWWVLLIWWSLLSVWFFMFMEWFFLESVFFSGSVLMMFVFYELTVVFVLFSVLGYGYQVEKISACYYLVFMLCFLVFLFCFCMIFFSFF